MKTICTTVSILETDKGYTTLKVDTVKDYRRCHLTFNVFKKSLLGGVIVGGELELTYEKDGSFLKLLEVKTAGPHHTCNWCCSEVLDGTECNCMITDRTKHHGTFQITALAKKKYRYSKGVRIRMQPGGNESPLWTVVYENSPLYQTVMELAVADEVMATMFTTDEESQWGELVFINTM